MDHFDPNKKAEQTLEICGTCKCSDVKLFLIVHYIAKMTMTIDVTYQLKYIFFCNCCSIHW